MTKYQKAAASAWRENENNERKTIDRKLAWRNERRSSGVNEAKQYQRIGTTLPGGNIPVVTTVTAIFRSCDIAAVPYVTLKHSGPRLTYV